MLKMRPCRICGTLTYNDDLCNFCEQKTQEMEKYSVMKGRRPTFRRKRT